MYFSLPRLIKDGLGGTKTTFSLPKICPWITPLSYLASLKTTSSFFESQLFLEPQFVATLVNVRTLETRPIPGPAWAAPLSNLDLTSCQLPND